MSQQDQACKFCCGTGEYTYHIFKNNVPGDPEHVQVECDYCNGKGYIRVEETKEENKCVA